MRTSRLLQIYLISYHKKSQIMHFSSAFVLAVVAALASSSVSAIPPQVDEVGATQCQNFCQTDEVCIKTGCVAWQFQGVFCIVSCVSALTSVQYGHWH
ncbi:uncharacterized protein HD556DRAFT_1356902 [Suillus plorans]|uniref:Uncharacterized protein n=1 Tax=Suillus plorans TaxID=116603 RepID=A0A9P7DL18_9AGAM|nr:uncharacterized protein HD556DRAFT_1356902 [Suillus plorans]KAG1797443.1 hypothetical protein HD556DRAFT_1356902 [Suillus plorans]